MGRTRAPKMHSVAGTKAVHPTASGHATRPISSICSRRTLRLPTKQLWFSIFAVRSTAEAPPGLTHPPTIARSSAITYFWFPRPKRLHFRTPNSPPQHHKFRQKFSAPDGYDCVFKTLLPLAPSFLRAGFSYGVLEVPNTCCIVSMGTNFYSRMTFSDGCFFACSTPGSDIYLWKESPTGYILHEVFASSCAHANPYLSRDGESIAVSGDRTTRFMAHKKLYRPPPPSQRLDPSPSTHRGSILEFPPDGMLAAFTMQRDNTVMVLNLKSGVPQLTIGTSIEIYGLGVIGNTVVVVGLGSAITWNLPAGHRVPDARIGPEDSSWTVKFSQWSPFVSGASISPNSRHIAVISRQYPHCLSICSTSTGGHLGETSIDGTTPGTTLWFSPDGRDVWCVRDSSEARRVRRVSRGQEALERLDSEWRTANVEGYPWRPSHGYQVTSGWRILGPDGKRLLMLPPPWQPYPVHRVWKGRFLALLHSAPVSEPVILELNP